MRGLYNIELYPLTRALVVIEPVSAVSDTGACVLLTLRARGRRKWVTEVMTITAVLDLWTVWKHKIKYILEDYRTDWRLYQSHLCPCDIPYLSVVLQPDYLTSLLYEQSILHLGHDSYQKSYQSLIHLYPYSADESWPKHH